ncbi:MAG: IS256 family transposase [Candidatus Binataceae bacterium]
MGKTGKSRVEEQAKTQRYLALKEFAREALWETVIFSGLAYAEEALEAERAAICGERYARLADRAAMRSGHVASSLTLGGRRVKIHRPRVRGAEGEVSLPSWQEWSSRDPLGHRAVEQMVVGVSTRGYHRSLEPLPQSVQVHGVSKSAVSERFVVGTATKLAGLMKRKLSGLRLLAVMVDGVHFAEHVVLAAIGIDLNGKKHVLGLREGATENAAACKELLADLTERGLPTERALLFIIDGAKALRKAITDTFGTRALIQRCREHKKRNVAEALPERMRAQTRSTMSQAYATADPKRARQLLDHLARTLEREYPGAAASLREGLDETLTILRLDLPESLTRVLSSTNLIENLFSRVRDMARRVRRWQGGGMILRWTAAGVLEAERNFRKIAGYRGLAKLDAALRAHDATLDNRKQAA